MTAGALVYPTRHAMGRSEPCGTRKLIRLPCSNPVEVRRRNSKPCQIMETRIVASSTACDIRRPTMENFRGTLFILLQLSLSATRSLASEASAQHQQAHAMDLVSSTEGVLRDLGLELKSVLFWNFGSILTEQSFRTDAFLLSSPPRPPVRYTARAVEYFLRYPLKIVAVVPQDNWQGKSGNWFYESRIFEEIDRELLLIVITTSTTSLRAAYRPTSKTLLRPTLFWSDRINWRLLCYENRDNLFRQYVPKPMSTCDLKPTKCRVEHISETMMHFAGKLSMKYYIEVKCNTTRAGNSYHLDQVRVDIATTRPSLDEMSYLNVLELRRSDMRCFSYIPSVTIDVTELTKAFDAEVWCLVLSTVILLAGAWSLIVRTSASDFSVEISMSILVVRELTLSPKSYSGTMIGCVALAFAFMVELLYSNTVMSSFLNPTGDYPAATLAVHCSKNSLCWHKDSLNLILNFRPLCDIPPHMLGAAERPLRTFHPSKFEVDHYFRLALFHPLTVGGDFGGTAWLDLHGTQTSTNIQRIIQHGIISPSRIKIYETKSSLVSRTRDGASKRSRERKNTMILKAIFLNVEPVGEYVSFSTTREVFDMVSFEKIQTLIGFCVSMSVGVLTVEIFRARKCGVRPFT